MKLELTTLEKLPIGAAFIRHDEWGDGKTVYVKLNDYGFGPQDKSACNCGTLNGGFTGGLVNELEVQEVDLGEHLQVVAYSLAYAAQERRKRVLQQ